MARIAHQRLYTAVHVAIHAKLHQVVVVPTTIADQIVATATADTTVIAGPMTVVVTTPAIALADSAFSNACFVAGRTDMAVADMATATSPAKKSNLSIPSVVEFGQRFFY